MLVRDSPVMRLGKLMLPFLAAAFGVYLLWTGTAQIVNSIRSRTWPSAPGEVLSSRVEVSPSYQQSSSTSRNRAHYTAKVRYAYMVNGRRFTNDVITWRDQSTGGSEAEQLVGRYPAGRKVSVFYDPDNPTTAVLEQRFAWSAFLRLAFGALFAVAGTLLVRFVARLS